MQERLNVIRKQTKQHAIIIDAFAATLIAPIMYDSGKQHFGFRYMKPTVIHFCTLKAVHAVSGLNAAAVLAENGYNQELCILMRTIDDCLSQIKFVLAGFDDGNLKKEQQEVLDKFFNDFARNSSDDFKGSAIRQKDVHDEIGKFIADKGNVQTSEQSPSKHISKLMSNVYRSFSNYIHAHYPEIMDMFGGKPARFHMNGTKGTPKDKESLDILETFTDSVSISIALMIQKFNMKEKLKNIPELASWFSS